MQKTYPYEMSKSEKKVFFNNVGTLKPGDSLNHVVGILGDPDKRAPLQAKGVNQPVRGTKISYCLKKVDSFVNEKQDQRVSLYFDNDDHLTKIISKNVLGLPIDPKLRGHLLEPRTEAEQPSSNHNDTPK